MINGITNAFSTVYGKNAPPCHYQNRAKNNTKIQVNIIEVFRVIQKVIRAQEREFVQTEEGRIYIKIKAGASRMSRSKRTEEKKHSGWVFLKKTHLGT